MRKILSFLFIIAMTSLFAGPKALWINYPEEQKAGINKERYFRIEFQTANKPVKSAAVFYLIDDDGTVSLNGQVVSRKSAMLSLYHTTMRTTKQYDVTGLLTKGRNALCATTINKGSIGGFILRLAITYQDGTIQEVFTDTTWKSSREKAAGWDQPGFADKSWQTPSFVGDCHVDPWCERYDMLPLYAQEDAVAEVERRQQVVENDRLLWEKLANEPAEEAKIVYKDGGAFFDIGGKIYRPVLYNYSCGGRDTPNFREKVKNFVEADIKLISFGIEAVQFWKGPNQYDYQELNRVISHAFSNAPDGRFIFAITFSHGPQWWNKLHPEELIKYGRQSTKFDSDDNIGSYEAPSYASELWVKEASETVRKLVEYIESTPYSKRIFGYRFGAGVYSEWHYYGMADSMPDISAPMIRLFRRYLRDKYQGDVEKLRAAWNQPQVTFENAVPPPEEVRLQYLDGSLRDPVAHAWSIDFLECLQISERDALLAINKAAKEACHGRALIGNYCGYFFNMGYTAEGWHLLNDDYMDSPYVDFQISPCCYSTEYRKLGGSQLSRSLTASYQLHNKMVIFEADSRTYLTKKSDPNRHVNTPQESVAMLSRDLAQAISKGCAYWHYDFGRDWYNDPAILAYFHNIAPVYDAVKDFSSCAEVAFIADWQSGYYHAIQAPEGGLQTYLSISEQTREFNAAGIQFDTFSFADIDNPALQNYKLIVFPQLFYMTPEKLSKLSALKKAGKTLLFLNAAGWLTAHGPDTESIFQTTGIHVDVLHEEVPILMGLADGTYMDPFGMTPRPALSFSPVVTITDPQATILGKVKLKNGAIVPAYARKQNADGSVSYLCAAPFVTASELRKIAKGIGVHTYCDSSKGVVFANNSMISFHTATPGQYTLHAKSPVKWTMVYPEKRDATALQADLTFQATEPNTYIFMIEE